MLSDNIQRAPDGSLQFAGHSVPALTEQYGTPLYLMDEQRLRHNCRMYTETFRECFGEKALPLYAGKAASFRASNHAGSNRCSPYPVRLSDFHCNLIRRKKQEKGTGMCFFVSSWRSD